MIRKWKYHGRLMTGMILRFFTVSFLLLTARMNAQIIRRRMNCFLWCFFVCLVWGIVNIFVAYHALRIAQVEIPEATIRQVRFGLIEVKAPEYHYYQFASEILSITGQYFGVFTVWLWIFYICSLGYSVRKIIFLFIASFLPVINLFVLLYLIREGRTQIASTQIDAGGQDEMEDEM